MRENVMNKIYPKFYKTNKKGTNQKKSSANSNTQDIYAAGKCGLFS